MKRSWIGALLGALCLVVAPSAFAAEPGLRVDTAWLGAHASGIEDVVAALSNVFMSTR